MRGNLNQTFYEMHRHEILNGDVADYSGAKFPSSTIKKITGSGSSHTGVLVWWRGRLMVLEATGKGVFPVPFSESVNRYNGVVRVHTPVIPFTANELDEMLEYGFLEFGKKYATIKMLLFGWKIFFKKDLDERDAFRQTLKLYCSQYTSKMYNRGHKDLKKNRADRFMSPEDVISSPVIRLRFTVSKRL